LGRAVSRFEAGLERPAVLEALNDYLLALRFLLEGGGPADLGLAMRVAALCAEPDHRNPTKAVVDRAQALERQLWSGEPAPAAPGAATPAETATEIEDLTRAILKDAACGHLGGDLRATADEILLADGLAIGDGSADQLGGAEEWDAVEAEAEEPDLVEEPEELDEDVEALPVDDEPDEAWDEPVTESEGGEEPDEDEQVLEPAGRMRMHPRPLPEETTLFDDHQIQGTEEAFGTPDTHSSETNGSVASERVAALLEDRPDERAKAADRVAYLFPRPETVEWNVRELSYERRRRAETAGARAGAS
jgi:hypothetical protein